MGPTAPFDNQLSSSALQVHSCGMLELLEGLALISLYTKMLLLSPFGANVGSAQFRGRWCSTNTDSHSSPSTDIV